MYRPDKILKAGSWAEPDFAGALAYASTNRAQVLDMRIAKFLHTALEAFDQFAGCSA